MYSLSFSTQEQKQKMGQRDVFLHFKLQYTTHPLFFLFKFVSFICLARYTLQ